MKKISIDKSVFELTDQYPELIEILYEQGFLGVKNPVMRNTLGRITTLRQGIKKQGKNLEELIRILKEKGFEVEI
ncbi:MAG: DUF1858 domain-containing protein [Candidatus Altiarchaeota archaeon]